MYLYGTKKNKQRKYQKNPIFQRKLLYYYSDTDNALFEMERAAESGGGKIRLSKNHNCRLEIKFL